MHATILERAGEHSRVTATVAEAFEDGVEVAKRAAKHSSDIPAARNLLSELREAYVSLPKHLQARITCLLRASAVPWDIESSVARLASREHRQIGVTVENK